MSILQIVTKVSKIISAIGMVVLVLLFLVSTDFRNNVLSHGLLGIASIIITLLLGSKKQGIFLKFIKAKGFNKTFWDDVWLVKS